MRKLIARLTPLITSATRQTVDATFNWGAAYNASNSTTNGSSTSYIYGQNGAIGYITYATQTDVSQFTQDGTVAAILPAGSNSSGAVPTSVTSVRDSYNFTEIVGGASDNNITSYNQFAVINGGAGNDNERMRWCIRVAANDAYHSVQFDGRVAA